MRSLFDPGSLWVGQKARGLRLGQGARAPVAVDDALSLAQGSGPVSVAVLDNDLDPDGTALSLVSAYAALGSAVAEADDTVTYTPPVGLTGFDTVIYEIENTGGRRATGQINITITDVPLNIAVTASNTLKVTAGTGPVTIAISEPVENAGSYTADTALLTGGPINIVAPALSGTPELGATLSAVDGLWITASDPPVIRALQWLRAGSAIPGATGSTYTVTAPDLGQGLSVRETATDDEGQRSVESSVVGAAFTPQGDSSRFGWWDADDAATLTQSGGVVAAWSDKVGGVSLQQSSGPDRPLTGSRTLGGRNLLEFPGSHFLIAPGRSWPASGDLAIHMVAEIDSLESAFAALLSIEATNDFQLDANATTQFDGRLNTSGVASPVPLSGGPFSGAQIVSLLFDLSGAGAADVFIGNIRRASTAYTQPLDPTGALHLMTNRSANAWITGAVGELICTERVDNRTQYHAYLADKWGLS